MQSQTFKADQGTLIDVSPTALERFGASWGRLGGRRRSPRDAKKGPAKGKVETPC